MNICNLYTIYFYSDLFVVCVIALIELLLYKWYNLSCFAFWYLVWVLFSSLLTLTLQLDFWVSNKHVNKQITELNYSNFKMSPFCWGLLVCITVKWGNTEKYNRSGLSLNSFLFWRLHASTFRRVHINLPWTQVTEPHLNKVLQFVREPGYCSRYSDWLRAGGPRGQSSSPGRVKNFLFSTLSIPALGSTQQYRGLFPRG
jgi:hypothetical protein